MSAVSAPAPRPSEAHGRRRRIAVIVVIAIVVVLAILLVVAEFVVRGIVNRTVAQQVERALPSGTTGTVTADAHGLVLPQLLTGSLDDVDISSKRITVQGVPLAVSANVRDVPVDGKGSTGAVRGRVALAAASVKDLGRFNSLLGALTLRKDGVSLTGTTKVLGVGVDYRLVGDVAAQSSGKGITVTPQKVSVTNSALGIDLGGNIPGVSGVPIQVCTAQFLPASIRLRSLDVTPTMATVRVAAAHLPLSEDGLQKAGTC